MLHRRHLLWTTLGILLLPTAALAQEKLPVVASFSILGDMAERVGGDRVEVTSLVGPDGDAHVFQLSPADARMVSDAELLFVNGLGFEGWIDRLVEASGFQGPVVVTTTGIDPMELDEEHGDEHAEEEHAEEEHAEDEHGHGDLDPHAWQSLANAKIYATNIATALTEVDPAGASIYEGNLEAYLAELEAVEKEVQDFVAGLAEDRRRIVTSHDAFGYYADAYGLEFLAPQAMSTEAEASARDVAALINQIRDENIAAVFLENVTDPRLLEQIVSETDAKIGGTLYSDALSGEGGPASTYLDMMRHNTRTIAAALSS